MTDLKYLPLTRAQMAQHLLIEADSRIDYGSHLPASSDGLLVAARSGHENLGDDGRGATLTLSEIR